MPFWNCTPGIFGNLLYLYTYDCVLTLQGYSISDLRGMTQSLPAIVSPAPKCLSSTCHHARQVSLFALGVVQCSRLPLTKKVKLNPKSVQPRADYRQGKVQGAGGTTDNPDLLNCSACNLSSPRHKSSRSSTFRSQMTGFLGHLLGPVPAWPTCIQIRNW